MYWPKFSKRALVRKLHSARLQSGVSCTYVRWTKYVGLKLYTKKGERNRCARVQGRAARAGLAPRVGQLIEVEVLTYGLNETTFWQHERGLRVTSPDLKVRKLYGYFTEHAERAKRHQRSWRKIEDLDERLMDIGIDHEDLHEGNLGLRRGKLVCIDFDSISCKLVRPRKGNR